VKLLQAVERVEARRRALPSGVAVGLVWSSDEREPLPGETCDVIQCAPDEGLPERWIMRPRPARSAADLGDVFNEAGELVGRVTHIAGSLVSIEPVAVAAGVGAPGAVPAPRRRPGRQAKPKPTLDAASRAAYFKSLYGLRRAVGARRCDGAASRATLSAARGRELQAAHDVEVGECDVRIEERFRPQLVPDLQRFTAEVVQRVEFALQGGAFEFRVCHSETTG